MIIRWNRLLDLVSKINGFKVDGITLFPFIFVRKGFGEVLLNHERIHYEQQVETGVVFFYIIYVVHYLINRIKFSPMKAYYNICFEKEANKKKDDLRYLFKRKGYDWIKEI